MSAVLDTDPDAGDSRVILKGDIPSPIDTPRGCRFSGRCPGALPGCKTALQTMTQAGDEHCYACGRAAEE
ncbi:MAG: hypothetical protein LBS19_11030 [Clostridiales bacterium]|nr:hypothetical protein [Clostridiales bacterium]